MPQRKARKSLPRLDMPTLLGAILPHVPDRGWSDALLRDAITICGGDVEDLRRLCPNGMRDVMGFWLDETDRAMTAALAQDRLFRTHRVRDKVAAAVRARLRLLAPQRDAVAALLIWAAHPLHAPWTSQRLFQTCDVIWRAAGDTSTDWNYYSKRLLLGYVLKTTLLFWLRDHGPDMRATEAFLDRRIAEVLKLGQLAGGLRGLAALRDLGGVDRLADLLRAFRPRKAA